jgi:hypothetical protein
VPCTTEHSTFAVTIIVVRYNGPAHISRRCTPMPYGAIFSTDSPGASSVGPTRAPKPKPIGNEVFVLLFPIATLCVVFLLWRRASSLRSVVAHQCVAVCCRLRRAHVVGCRRGEAGRATYGCRRTTGRPRPRSSRTTMTTTTSRSLRVLSRVPGRLRTTVPPAPRRPHGWPFDLGGTWWTAGRCVFRLRRASVCSHHLGRSISSIVSRVI